jgi:meso-butanediol dehydrogenase / (S,S)-butanediol dehydrogenase / diacetyl reductase
MHDVLSGKVALVTGAGRRSGIGYAIARRLAEHGARVVVSDLCRRAVHDAAFEQAAWDELRGIADELGGSGEHLALKADVTNSHEVAALFDAAQQALGPVELLVNNAGIALTKSLIDTTLDEWERVLRVNATSVFVCSSEAVRRMTQHGVAGRIVNMASISGKEGWPNFGAYTAAKFAVVGITQTLAREVAAHNITVNAVCPGLVATTMSDQITQQLAALRGVSPESIDHDQLGRVPLGRYATPDDVANTVAFLVSPAADYITGQAINVCGGLMVGR